MSRSVEVVVNDRMQRDYRYTRTAPMGSAFDPAFEPELTPRKMLELGVFCGKYMTDWPRQRQALLQWAYDSRVL